MKGTLNLHRGFAQSGEEINYKTSIFPGGEVYVKVDIPSWCSSVRINSRCTNSEDLMRIIMVTDAVRRAGVVWINLFIPYFPYSRQDRICEKGESFSLKVMCKLLEVQNYTNIYTYDNHSNVAEVLLDNLYNYDNIREVKAFMNYSDILQDVTLIIPDAGAMKKGYELYNKIDNLKSAVQCNKVRIAGYLTIDKIMANIKGKVVLVVDDICDGGRTFVELGKRLNEAQVHKAFLFVSHGIFSSGFYELKKYYMGIGTTNSIREVIAPVDCVTFPIIY